MAGVQLASPLNAGNCIDVLKSWVAMWPLRVVLPEFANFCNNSHRLILENEMQCLVGCIMDSVVLELKNISEALHLMTEQNVFWDILKTLPSAVLASVTAIAAAMATVYAGWRRVERNTAIALYLEIKRIQSELDRSINQPHATSYINCNIMLSGEKSCPIYISSASVAGCVKTNALVSIINFYNSFLSSHAEIDKKNGAYIYSKEEINRVIVLANIALKKIEDIYKTERLYVR